MAATATETRRQSAVAAGQPETPPNPYEVAQRFREERETSADLQRRVRDYEQLTPKQQFDTAVEAGVIPEGSRFVAGLDIDTADKRRIQRLTQVTGRPVGTWGYYSPTQLQEIATEKKRRERVADITKTYVTSVKARQKQEIAAFEETLKDMPGSLQQAYRTGGVAGYNKAVAAYNKSLDKLKASQDKAFKALEPYQVGDGYNITAFLKENPDKTYMLRELKFSPASIREAQASARESEPPTVSEEATGFSLFVEGTKTTKKELTKLWDNITVPLIQSVFVKEEARGPKHEERINKIRDSINDTADKIKDDPGAAVMVGLETVIPGFYTATHWDKLSPSEKIFSVTADAAIIGGILLYWAGTAPYSASVGDRWTRTKVKTMANKATKANEVAYQQLTKELPAAQANKLIAASQNLQKALSGGNANQILDATNQLRLAAPSGTATSVVDDIVNNARRGSIDTLKAQDKLYSEWLRKHPGSAKRKLVEELQQLNRRQLATITREKVSMPLEEFRVLSGQSVPAVTTTKAVSVVKPKYKISVLPVKAAKYAPVVAAIAGTATETAVVRERQQAKPITGRDVYNKPITETLPNTRIVVSGQTSTSPQLEPMVRQAIATSTEHAIEMANELAPSGVPATEIREAVANAILEETQTLPDTAVQNEVRPYVQPLTELAVSVAIDTSTKTKAQTQPKILRGDGKKQAGKLTEKEKKSATAWPQGFGWWIVFKRNGKKYAFFYKGQMAPRGIKQVKQGKGEAARGIQQYKGKAPTSFKLPMGAVDVAVSGAEQEPGKAGAIKFTPTRPRITAKRPRIR